MRMMLKATIPCENGNAAIKDGSIGRIIGKWSEQYKPEASYFTTDGGDRAAYFFFDLKDPSDIPSVAEPFFTGLNAKIEVQPVMNPQDLKAGLDKLKL